ncbi:kinesin-like protein KIN-7F isoform X2 [Bradysia coprophila]|uniref:kinesin-like protein KIN-7F isoform X2 n=1 Tax=Bradysia coprophila TaxID=38358 RepID=UPI00187DB6D5|nr:kinesin-like protein KIN-7F isoform X2 [Bradysia coprophila]
MYQSNEEENNNKMNRTKVLVRIRPRTNQEIRLNLKDHSSIRTSIQSFNFEHTFGPTCTNSDVYEVIAPMVERCKIGYNATVLSYGQKSSGKTYTMIGNDNDPGVARLAIHQLFKNNQPPFKRLFIIRAGFIEIHNETMYDLLNHRQIVQFDGQIELHMKLSNKEVVVNDKDTILELLDKGNKARLPTTKADAPSSSHTIFRIVIENQDQALEMAPVEVSYLNLVDLDRSEGAQVKNENGNCFDKSLKYLELAVKALSNGEKFRNSSKSKLTRLLNLGGNANTAIICHVTPTSPNQSNITLNFANEARNVRTKTVCNKVYSDDVMIRQVRADIARLQRLKNELDPPLLNSSKIDCEMAHLNSILLLEKDMRPQGHIMKAVTTNQVLKIRSFFLGLAGMRKRYQHAEMKDMSVDTQSRPQRKSNAIKWSDFYLERVGFELSLNMRRYLKYGKNVIGRSTSDSDVDICVDSLECSRKHCFIDISTDLSVTVKDLNSSNGTTVNGIKYKGKTIDLHEGDVITIVEGSHSLVGNLDCTAYRLCRFTTEKIKFFDLDDGSIVVNDDDGDNDTPYYPVKVELESPEAHIVDQPTTTLTAQNQADSIIVIDDDDDNDTSYYPVKMELELPEPSRLAESETEQLMTRPKPTILHQVDTIIVINDEDVSDTPLNTVEMELELPESSRFVDIDTEQSVARPIPTIQNQADPIIVINDDDDGNDTSYYPVKMELELPEPSRLAESETELLTTRPTPAILNQADTIIGINDDGGSDTPCNTLEIELEPPQPSRLVQIETEKPITTQMLNPLPTMSALTTTGSMTSASPTSGSMTSASTTPGSTMTVSSKLSQKHDGEFNLDSFIFDDGAFGDLNDIMAIPAIQDENVARIQSENEKLVQQLQYYEAEKQLQAEEITRLQAKLLAQEAEKNILLYENATTAAKLREIEKDRDILREKNLKHIGEMLEHFYEGKKSKTD